MWPILQLWFTPKIKWNYRYRLYKSSQRQNWNWIVKTYMTNVIYDETIQDNNVIYHTSAVYDKSEIELLWLTG